MSTFDESLENGKVGESLIAQWLRRRGNSVLPVYETSESFKGPRVLSPSGEFIATDMFVFNGARCLWAEAKNKSAFTWWRIGGIWETGIDFRHYENYWRVRELSGLPTWLFFLQHAGTAKDSPSGCPTGLYGGELGYLRERESHRYPPDEPHRMVYWGEHVLRKFAELEDVIGNPMRAQRGANAPSSVADSGIADWLNEYGDE